MNCAESQDLLLDLAYGELAPSRAAEVEAHVHGCAACRAEKEQLDDARRTAAPLREVEEPSAAFDGPILSAAKAEAGMQADGTPGPIVEVSASVKPLGLQAARLDPHARMKGTPGSARPRWGMRAAVFGSIAAAAALAVVVTSSLRPDRSSEMAREEVAPIQVRTPGTPVSDALDGALAHRDRAGEATENVGGKAAETAPLPPAAPPALLAKKKAAAAKKDQPPPVLAKKDQPPPVLAKNDVGESLARSRAAQGVVGGMTAPARTDATAAAPKAVDEARAQRVKEQKLEEKGPLPTAERQVDSSNRAAAPATAPSEARPAAVAPVSRYAPPPSQAKDPDGVEEDASAARRRGDYVRAAALYREASALRRAADPARAAWDMAHAVECLAAGGQVDDAIAARKELLRVFPGQTGPKAAADSALRSVRLPPDDEPAKQ